MQKTPFKYLVIQKKHLISEVSKLSEELNCDIEEITAAITTEKLKEEIANMIHFNRYLCSPGLCKACIKKIPHDDPIFDHESIFNY